MFVVFRVRIKIFIIGYLLVFFLEKRLFICSDVVRGVRRNWRLEDFFRLVGCFYFGFL